MMISLKRIGVITILLSICSCSLAVNSESAGYVTNIAGGKSYYHLMYSLRIENINSVDKLTKDEFYQNGGQFEVDIKKDLFPIRSPNCKSNIILRMPWVQEGVSLDKKYDLYKDISSLLDSGDNNRKEVNVAIELNPYIASDEKGIYLTQCNVFFRSKNGEYLSNIKP
jgi:hypothetical protein